MGNLNFDENNLTSWANVGKSELNDVYKFTGKKNIPEVWLNKSCCNITTCVEMAKFLASEKDFYNKIMCEKCRFRVCNSCILANSHLNITEKIKYIQYWNSIKIVRHDSGLGIQSDYFYKDDPKIVFKPENTNFIQAKRNLEGNIKRLKKKGKNALKTVVDEVNKKIDLGTLAECTPEEWTFIKSNPHHYRLTTMVTGQL